MTKRYVNTIINLLIAITALIVISGVIVPLILQLSGKAETNTSADRYQKLDLTGKAVAAKGKPWSCVFDQTTGLTWENKTRDEGLRHYKWTYTWSPYQINSRYQRQQEGSCHLLSHCSTNNYLQAVNQNKLCGHDDWRLPNQAELASLIDTSNPRSQKQICDCAFSNTLASSYWTADLQRDGKIPGINFGNGENRLFPAYASLHIRLVRGPALEPAGNQPVEQPR